MAEFRVGNGPAVPAHVSDSNPATTKVQVRRSGVSPIAIAVSALICGSAFAYAVTRTGPEVPDSASASSVVEAKASASNQPAAEPDDPPATIDKRAPAGETVVREARVAPSPETALETAAEPAPLAEDNPRWAQSPKADSIEWEGQVAVADSEAEIALLERKFSAETADTSAAGPESGDGPELAYAAVTKERERSNARREPAEPEFGDISMVAARTKDFVNMRADRKKGAPVVTVVPEGAEVRIAEGCRGWCATEFEGKRGFIYASYLEFLDSRRTASIGNEAPVTSKASSLAERIGAETPTEAEHRWQIGR